MIRTSFQHDDLINDEVLSLSQNSVKVIEYCFYFVATVTSEQDAGSAEQ